MGGFLHSVFDGIERSSKKLEQDFTAARLVMCLLLCLVLLCLILLCLVLLCIVHSLGYSYVLCLLSQLYAAPTLLLSKCWLTNIITGDVFSHL